VKDAGRLFAQEAGPSYTSGQSRFDAALLRRNPEFQRQQQDILAREKALREKNQAAINAQTEAAQKKVSDAFTQSTGAAREKLGGLAEDVITGAKERASGEEQSRAAIDAKAKASAELDAIRKQIRGDFGSADPRSLESRSMKYLDQDFDLSPYASVNRDVNWKDVLTDPEAETYNRIEGLLGSDAMLTAGQGAGDAYGFRNQDAYRAVLDNILNQRRQQDIQSQGKLDAIRSAAEPRVSEYNTRDLAQNAREAAMNEMGKLGMFFNEDDYAKMEAQGLIRENKPMTWQDVLTADEMAQASALNEDLGGYGTYNTYRPEYDVNALRDYYNTYVKPEMDRIIAQNQPKSPSGPVGEPPPPPAASPGASTATNPSPMPVDQRNAGQGGPQPADPTKPLNKQWQDENLGRPQPAPEPEKKTKTSGGGSSSAKTKYQR
jgi:hypothetical protein